jgi:hypothetical protein
MNIFIAGSSHNDIPEKYLALADEVSKLLVKNNNLILGGIPSTLPKNSMMGKYSSNFTNQEYVTVSKYANNLNKNELDKTTILDYTMDRTKTLYNKADVILFLPGGIGTLAELSSTLEEARTNTTNKKIIIYNYEGFFDNILNWINKNNKENFIYKEDITNYKVVNNTLELIKEMER